MMKGYASLNRESQATIQEVDAIGKEIGVSAAQVALAWLRYRTVPVIPIIGARKLTQLEDNIKSLGVTLSSEQLQRLNQVSAISLGFPHDFLAMDMVKTFTFGGMRDRIKK